MWFLSDIINDLALLFPYIKELKARYRSYGLEIDYAILVVENGFKIVITPYEPIYTRTKQD